jgi:hypothetical protein
LGKTPRKRWNHHVKPLAVFFGEHID